MHKGRHHDNPWTGWDQPDTAGLTPFQSRCEAALVELLASRAIEFSGRSVEGEGERYIRGTLGDTSWTVWIYEDQAQLSGPSGAGVNLERCDAPTPEELIATFLHRIGSVLDDLSAAPQS